MNPPWPKWTTLRAEDVTALPPEERGGWESDRTCQIREPGKKETHPAKAPYFFHCLKHLQQARGLRIQVQPRDRRDRGECAMCGKEADRLPVTMTDRVACVEAERTNSTVARLSSRRFCTRCENMRGAVCEGRVCQEAGTQNKILRAGCCAVTKNGERRHCQTCCSARKRGLLERQNRTLGNKAGTLSGKARQKTRRERRSRVAELRRNGLSQNQIATELKVSESTIKVDLKRLREMTQAAKAAFHRKWLDRRTKVGELAQAGLDDKAIAEAVGITTETVQKHLESLNEVRKEEARRFARTSTQNRRRTVGKLRGKGLTPDEIAGELKLPKKTVNSDIKALGNMTQAANQVVREKAAMRRTKIGALMQQGLNRREMAETIGIKERTVQEHIDAILEEERQRETTTPSPSPSQPTTGAAKAAGSTARPHKAKAPRQAKTKTKKTQHQAKKPQ